MLSSDSEPQNPIIT